MNPGILKALLACGMLFAPLVATAGAAVVSSEAAPTVAPEDLEEAYRALKNLAPTSTTNPDATLALGIVQYRIGEFDAARRALSSLIGTGLEARARYYLGQIAESRANYATARSFYQQAAGQYDDLRAQELADNALLSLSFLHRGGARSHSVSDRSFAYVSGKAKGVDGLTDPDDTAAVDTTDTAFDVLLTGSLSIWAPNENTALRVGGTLFREDYVDYSDFDLQMLGASAQLDRALGRHLLKAQIGFSALTLAGDDYLSYRDVSLSDTVILSSKWDLELAALVRDVSSESADYDHYDGDSLRTMFVLKGREDNPWRFDYTYRKDDAADRYLQFANDAGDVFDGFVSYSRDYHRIRGRYEVKWTDRLSQTLTASLRQAEYDDPNLYLAGSTDSALTETLREATRYSIGSELSWTIGERLRLLGEVEFYDEDSNIDLYDFNSLQIGLGVDFFF